MEGGLGEIKTILDKVYSWDRQTLTLFETKSIHHSTELSNFIETFPGYRCITQEQ